MPTYVYACENPDCEIAGNRFEMNVPIADRDLQWCARCGTQFERKVAFSGLTWAPSVGGMR